MPPSNFSHSAGLYRTMGLMICCLGHSHTRPAPTDSIKRKRYRESGNRYVRLRPGERLALRPLPLKHKREKIEMGRRDKIGLFFDPTAFVTRSLGFSLDPARDVTPRLVGRNPCGLSVTSNWKLAAMDKKSRLECDIITKELRKKRGCTCRRIGPPTARQGRAWQRFECSAVQCFIGHTDFWATICWEGQNLFFSFFQARFRHTQGPKDGQSCRITCRAALTCVELLLRCPALLCVPVQLEAHGRIDFCYKP